MYCFEIGNLKVIIAFDIFLFTWQNRPHGLWQLTKVDRKMLIFGENVRKQGTPVQLGLGNVESHAEVEPVEGEKDLHGVAAQVKVTPDHVTDTKPNK